MFYMILFMIVVNYLYLINFEYFIKYCTVKKYLQSLKAERVFTHTQIQ